MTTPARVATGLVGATAARVALAGLARRPPGGSTRWSRRNHRGESVTLLEGPAYVLAATTAAALAPGLPARLRVAGLLAAVGAGALGTYDDLAGSGDRRGFKGHLGALARGEVTSGAVKILGIGATGLLAGALVRDHPVDRLLAGVVVAGNANLLNLLDLRPGRALKAGLVHLPLAGGRHPAGLLAVAATAPAAALLPDDLGERTMLGDAGANALGALLGVAAAARAGRTWLALHAASLVALTIASERVSFTRVIEATPPLRRLDSLGRRPAPGT